ATHGNDVGSEKIVTGYLVVPASQFRNVLSGTRLFGRCGDYGASSSSAFRWGTSMSVSQFRHSNRSTLGRCSADLLACMAIPQSGQCRRGTRAFCGMAVPTTLIPPTAT